MNEIRILTVRQPWAWAIIHGGKDVENRTRNIAGSYRGPVAIHAGARYDEEWASDALADAMNNHPGVWNEPQPWRAQIGAASGAIVGVVDLVAVHHPDVGWGCPASPGDLLPRCSAWADPGRHHLVLENPRPLDEPIPYRGALGLRRLDAETTAAVWLQIRGQR